MVAWTAILSRTEMNKNLIKLGSNLLFLSLFLVLIWKFASPQQAIETLKRIPASYLLGGIFCLITTYGLRAHRFYLLFSDLNLSWVTLLKVMLQHNAINNLLPFRLGELSFPLLLKKSSDVRFQQSAKVLITARLFDLAIMGAIALIIVSLILFQISAMFFIIELVILGLGTLLIILLFTLKKLPFYTFIHNYFDYLKQHLTRVGILSILIWLLKLAGQALWLAPMLQTRWFYSLLAVLIIEGTAILPVNGPLNFGSIEGAAMVVLTPLGLEPSTILAAVLNLHIAIIMLAALGYLVSLVLPNAPEKEAQP